MHSHTVQLHNQMVPRVGECCRTDSSDSAESENAEGSLVWQSQVPLMHRCSHRVVLAQQRAQLKATMLPKAGGCSPRLSARCPVQSGRSSAHREPRRR
jgi:hypothetical protein